MAIARTCIRMRRILKFMLFKMLNEIMAASVCELSGCDLFPRSNIFTAHGRCVVDGLLLSRLCVASIAAALCIAFRFRLSGRAPQVHSFRPNNNTIIYVMKSLNKLIALESHKAHTACACP